MRAKIIEGAFGATKTPHTDGIHSWVKGLEVDLRSVRQEASDLDLLQHSRENGSTGLERGTTT